jgi:hypothetical protein
VVLHADKLDAADNGHRVVPLPAIVLELSWRKFGIHYEGGYWPPDGGQWALGPAVRPVVLFRRFRALAKLIT